MTSTPEPTPTTAESASREEAEAHGAGQLDVTLAATPSAPERKPSREEQLLLYQVVESRRLATDGMVWQVPGLALTAQAFLVTIELGPGVGAVAQAVTGLLAAAISLMSVQLMLRHKRSELADSMWLERFERESGWEVVHGKREEFADRNGVASGWLVRYRSYRVWILGMGAFGLVGLLAAVHALLR